VDNNGQPQHAFIGKLKIRTSALKPAHKHDGWCQPIDRLAQRLHCVVANPTWRE
jgi:hypothetical protein